MVESLQEYIQILHNNNTKVVEENFAKLQKVM